MGMENSGITSLSAQHYSELIYSLLAMTANSLSNFLNIIVPALIIKNAANQPFDSLHWLNWHCCTLFYFE